MDINQQEGKSQIIVIRVSIIVSIIIFLITLGAAIVTDSITLLLDASAECIMIFMAVVLHSSIKKIHMPPDRVFNFGYDKFEPFTVVIQGAMIVLTCVISSYFAIQDIVHADDIIRYDIPMYASALSGAIAVLTAIYLRKVSIKTRSNMLKASSLHWFIDGLLSFGMYLGFAFGLYMYRRGYTGITPYIDPAMALILAIILIWTPLKMMRDSIRQLLDAAPIKNVRDEIEKIIEKHKAGSFGIHKIRMRRAGEKIFLDICFMIHGHTTMTQAREFAENFEKDIAARFPKYDIIVYFYPHTIGAGR